MKKPKVLVTRIIPREGIELLGEMCDVTVHSEDRPMTRKELLSGIRDKDGVLSLLTDKIDAEVFDTAVQARGFANYAVGFDNMDVKEATARKIPLSNTPDVLTGATAEMAWALLFAAGRRVVESDTVMRSGLWKGWGPLQFIGTDVSGRTLGIAGAGRIGTAMARMSKGFGMRVLYTDKQVNEELEKELGAVKVAFDELLKESDFLSIHVPLFSGTRHLFNRDAFRKMKKSAVLINTSRGPVVDEEALVEALSSGEIGAAGLDVYELEPEMVQGLNTLSNVVLTPHTASATVSSRTGMAVMAAENLLAMLRGEKPPQCLNPEIYG